MRRIYEDMAYGPLPDRNNFWRGTVEAPPDCDPPEADAHCDVAIIGGGFTGLNAALTLAQAGRAVIVIEASQPGWGASGRNGGFCCMGGAKADARTLIRRFGESRTKRYYAAERQAVDHVNALLEDHGIDADTHSQGETLCAHRPRDVPGLTAFADEMRHFHGLDCEVLTREAMAERGMTSPALHGAVTTPVGFALNPVKYLDGLARAARQAGARLFCGAPVTHVAELPSGQIRLTGAQFRVTARHLIVATNGYSSDDIPPGLGARYLPSQSNIIVTRRLSEDELAAQGWTSDQMCFDTRHLLHYFRLMPDRRMLFGMRSSLRVTPRSLARSAARTRADFERFFPEWRHVETPWAWSGLVCLSRSLTPYAGPLPDMPNAWAALAWHGNGVAMGSYAGHLVAHQVLGTEGGPRTPAVMRAPLRRFELGRWRRLLLPPAYGWFALRDRL